VANESYSPFSIPESAYEPIRDLVEMTPEDFEAFMAALTAAAPSISPASLTRDISRSVAPRLSRSLVTALVNEIMTLEYLKQDSEMHPTEFASAISASALEAASDEFKFTPEDARALTERLFKIFTSDRVLELTTKSNAVMTDYDNLFYSAKILTDARPVFNDDASKLEGMGIVHMLRIHFGHNNNHEDFFTALDSIDLKKLKALIERAEKKSELLQAMFKANNIIYLDVEEPNAGD
jgi:hypothetical protein